MYMYCVLYGSKIVSINGSKIVLINGSKIVSIKIQTVSILIYCVSLYLMYRDFYK